MSTYFEAAGASMKIIPLSIGYIVTDGETLAKTFVISMFETRRQCLLAAVSCSFEDQPRDRGDVEKDFVRYLIVEL
jgi:hypothetical protein